MNVDDSEVAPPEAGLDIFIGGPEKVAIVVVDYDPSWPGRFAVERARIATALGPRSLAIEHVGSTAVPDLAAKPIIDICVVVADSADEGAYVPALEAAGYELRIREPALEEHRMLRTPEHDVHVHVFSEGAQEVGQYLALRDRLRRDETDRALYAATKRELAARDWPTMRHYSEAKSDVVDAILRRATS